MKHIKKFNETKKDDNTEEQEVLFNAEVLVDKDEKPSFTTDVDDQESLQKEFDKIRKVKSFEKFTNESSKDMKYVSDVIKSKYGVDVDVTNDVNKTKVYISTHSTGKKLPISLINDIKNTDRSAKLDTTGREIESNFSILTKMFATNK